MTKVDIISGFLGAGKTTLIKKLIQEVFAGQKVVLIENEFGEIGIDGGFLKDAGINITEMNSGCICCSLVGDFGKALKEVTERFAPDHIIIEPSGVGKLSDVRKAVEDAADEAGLVLNGLVTVADASKVKMYMKNFGEFYNNQVEFAGTIILSRTQKMSEEKLLAAVSLIQEKNPKAAVITTPWDELTGAQIMEAIEKTRSLADELMAEAKEHEHHHHDGECDHDHEEEHEHHHHHDECGCGHDHDEEHEHHHHHDGECGHDHDEEHEHHHHHDGECGHDHDEEHEHHHHHDGECGHDHEEEHEHHHHHDDECGCGHDHDEEHEHHHHDGECDHDHEHHHHHDDECGCGHHHHHHHADEVFTSWGQETPRKYTKAEVEEILTKLDDGTYGTILRAKGMLPTAEGVWIHFDYVPEEHEVREGSADYTGRLCVIGADLKEDKLKELFQL
jgi:G3E family GTPase